VESEKVWDYRNSGGHPKKVSGPLGGPFFWVGNTDTTFLFPRGGYFWATWRHEKNFVFGERAAHKKKPGVGPTKNSVGETHTNRWKNSGVLSNNAAQKSNNN